MLAELRSQFPDVDARAGSAEAIPVPDSSADAVLVGQAWHWFDQDRALDEAARVLRSGGVLAVLWNSDDAGVEWVAGYHAVVQRNHTVPRTSLTEAIPALPTHPAFTRTEFHTAPNPFPTTAEGLVGNVATHSWMLVSEPDERRRVLGELRAYLAGRPETSDGEFELPLVTEIVRALRK
jgi:SAM-dependent methyltransferase